MEYIITSKLGNGHVGHSRNFECFKLGLAMEYEFSMH
jgi:hypothetical protein